MHSGVDYPSRQDWHRSSERALQRKHDLQDKLGAECEAEDSQESEVINDELDEGHDDQTALIGADAKAH